MLIIFSSPLCFFRYLSKIVDYLRFLRLVRSECINTILSVKVHISCSSFFPNLSCSILRILISLILVPIWGFTSLSLILWSLRIITEIFAQDWNLKRLHKWFRYRGIIFQINFSYLKRLSLFMVCQMTMTVIALGLSIKRF